MVFGEPAIAIAVDLRLRCHVQQHSCFLMNGMPLSGMSHPYVHCALAKRWGPEPLMIETSSDLPSGSGMGSSAAVTASLLAAFRALKGEDLAEEELAKDAFDIESTVQGRASPVDTSVITHGRGILIDSMAGDNLLWQIKRDARQWYVHDCQVPDMSMVVGFTGINAATGPLVAKVKRYYDRTAFAKGIIQEIGELVREGTGCLKGRDLVGLGELMTRDHKLLAILGVSHPSLDRLVYASLPHSYGAKLTGAGGGGSMIALTDQPEKVAEIIRMNGGIPMAISTGQEGVRVDDPGSTSNIM